MAEELTEAIEASCQQTAASAPTLIEACDAALRKGLSWYASLILEGYEPRQANETVSDALHHLGFLAQPYDIVDILASWSRHGPRSPSNLPVLDVMHDVDVLQSA